MTAPAKKRQQPANTVQSVFTMHDQQFRMHMQKWSRHRRLGFWSRQAHDRQHEEDPDQAHTHSATKAHARNT